jgi:hypothetical protein
LIWRVTVDYKLTSLCLAAMFSNHVIRKSGEFW